MKRLTAAMIRLLLSVMFTIAGSMAYDHAVNDTQSIQNGIIVNRGQASSIAASERISVVFSGETGETQTGFMNFEK